MPNDTDTATMLLVFPNDEQEFDRGLKGMANLDSKAAAWCPARVSMERLVCLINGRAIALNTRDEQCRLDAGAHRGQVQPLDRARFMLDMVKPPVVVCIGIAAYNLVQNLSLLWQPSIVVARHTITWSLDYEDALAQEINGLLLAPARRSDIFSDWHAQLSVKSADDRPNGSDKPFAPHPLDR